MSTDIFQGTGQSAPVLYHDITDRGTFITAEYAARAHRDKSRDAMGNPLGGINELEARVRYEGEFIEQNGEVLTVGMVPIERRWCIGPSIDGVADLLPISEFNTQYEEWYAHSYAYRDQPPDDVQKAYKPNPKDWVSWKVNPIDKSKLVPLGMPTPGTVPKFDPKRDGSHIYDPESDSFTTDTPKEDPRDARIAELERSLHAAELAAAPPEGPILSARCGWDENPSRIAQHEAKCGACQQIKEGNSKQEE